MDLTVKWFQQTYPNFVTSMQKCSHHFDHNNINPYHIEDDAWTHTMMVCNQMRHCNREVQLAGLLHDIGKPVTREVNPRNNHVRFLNHDAVGAFLSLEILKHPHLNLNNQQITHIFNLIALHTQVYKLTLEQLSELCTNNIKLANDLYALGKADNDGRFSEVKGSQDPFVSQSKMLKKKEKTVTILCGLPASGKSTYVRMFKEIKPETFVVNRDSIIQGMLPELSYNEAWKYVDQKEVDKELQELYQESLNSNDIIIDMTHMSKKSRRKSLARYGKDWNKNCVVFLPDLPTLFKRNEERKGKIISKEVINKMMVSFYPPTYEEFDNIEYVL